MTRIAWLTDIHLNFLEPPELDAFFDSVRDCDAQAVLISGDIGEARSVVGWMRELEHRIARPIYFVLGNHDFYFGSIAEVREQVAALCERSERLHYLTASEWFPLSAATGLIGHDGWADAREGNYEQSYVMMNDYKLIRELAQYNKMERWEVLKRFGDEAADHVRRVLPMALAEREHVILLTHVPPLRAACWHEGQISDDEWAPHFTCQALGRAMLEIMADYPSRRLTVLCGHTHGEGITRPAENIVVHTGGAVYGKPEITRLMDV